VSEWFAQPDSPEQGEGLRFSCTQCGNCCSGPEGYVLVSDEEAASLARRMNLTVPEFLERYTRETVEGRSLTERLTANGLDCVFLDRESHPGRAVCSVYEDRPAQCRTWPFWESLIRSRAHWENGKRTCPGIGKGRLYTVQEIRIQRDAIRM
jgi:Fe-S-cluster containining protein